VESDLLVGAGMVERVRTCYFGLEIFGFAPSFTAAVHAGRLEVVEESEASLAMGILQTVVDPYSGETLTAFPAIGCDVAVLHALEADPEGNAALGRHWGVDRELSLIASTVIITAERIVPRLEQADVIAPSVRAVVEAPGGAWPTSCHSPLSAGRHGIAALHRCRRDAGPGHAARRVGRGPAGRRRRLNLSPLP
jgi:glutaconate CoA-transferase subunit A